MINQWVSRTCCPSSWNRRITSYSSISTRSPLRPPISGVYCVMARKTTEPCVSSCIGLLDKLHELVSSVIRRKPQQTADWEEAPAAAVYLVTGNDVVASDSYSSITCRRWWSGRTNLPGGRLKTIDRHSSPLQTSAITAITDIVDIIDGIWQPS